MNKIYLSIYLLAHQSTKFGCIFHNFSQKTPNLKKMCAFPAMIAEDNTIFIFLGLVCLGKHT